MVLGKVHSIKRRLLAAGMSVLFLVGGILPAAGEAGKKTAASFSPTGDSWKEILTTKYAEDSYVRSLQAYPNAVRHQKGPVLDSEALLPESQNVRQETGEKAEKAVCFDQEGRAVYQVEIAADGFYQLGISYDYTDTQTEDNSDLSIEIDGRPPFYQSKELALPRVWAQEEIVHLTGGNDLQPDTLQVKEKAVYFPADESGMNGRYWFYFTEGAHHLTLYSSHGGFRVYKVELGMEEAGEKEGDAYPYTGDVIQIEGEEFFRKNDRRIVGGTDRTDARTSPNDPMYKKVNILAGSKYLKPNQSVSWTFIVKEKGRYRLNVRYMQESLPGLFASRNLYIDGKPIAFEEDAVRFPYTDTWKLATAADAQGDELLLDLDAGEHTLTMEVTLGALQNYVLRLDDVIFAMNYLYRKIIMITSTTPDPYRDYHLEEEIPYLIPYFRELEGEISAISDGLRELGAEGGMLSVLNQTAEQLREFSEDSYRLQDRLSHYVSNISSLSALVMEMQEGPLSIDCLWLESTPERNVKWKAGFWESMLFHIQAFFGSFFCDYSTFGSELGGDRESITAWFSGSREQSELLQDMINEDFGAAEPGISVSLRLVTLPLTQAILAGTAPDVCLAVARNQPINLGCRGVLEDLSAHEGFAKQREIFGDNLLTPYSYEGAVYGLPVTLDYHMMFYRRDILEELGVRPPEDWEAFYALIPLMQRNNLYIGLPYTMVGATEGSLGVKDIFATLLLQNGAQLYTEDLSAVRLDDPEITAVFREWTEFYSKYQFSLEYNLYNRFRTGEMPLAIASYSVYSQLSGAAPEIKGMWGMTQIPGTRREDGSIDRTQAASGTAAIMLRGSEHKEAAWKFLQWWTSAEAQGAYGNAVEDLMGEAARYTPANPDAVKLLPWDEDNYNALMEQRSRIQELPEVLGGYYVVRSIDNAFRTVLYNGANYKEALLTQNVIINTELERKQREFKD